MYTPIFDFRSGISNPIISFKTIYEIQNSWDYVSLQYTTNGGVDWYTLGASSESENFTHRFSGITSNVRQVSRGISFLQGEAAVQFRFLFSSDGSITRKGMIIDDFMIYSLSHDIGLSPNMLATTIGDFSQNSFQIRAMINNHGENLSNVELPFSFQVDNGAVQQTAANINLNRGGWNNINIGAPVEIPLPGYYRFKVWSDWDLDQRRFNDTTNAWVLNNGSRIESIPYVNDFETEDNRWFAFGELNSSWTLGTPNKLGYNNEAPSGENAWILGGEDSPYIANERSSLLSPVFNLSTENIGGGAYLRFNIAYDLGIDRIYIEYSTSSGNFWTLFPYQEDSQGYSSFRYLSGNSGGEVAFSSSLDFLAGQSNVKFRFRVESYGGTPGQGAVIDDFRIDLVENDLAISSLVTPDVNQVAFTEPQELKIELRNMASSLSLPTLNLSYQINEETPVNQQFAIELDPTEAVELAFTELMDIATPGQYQVKVWHSFDLDERKGNDTLSFQLVNYGGAITDFPYENDFEAEDFSWSSQGQNNTWVFGIPNKLGFNGEAPSGEKAWILGGLSGNYSNNENSSLISPVFDFRNVDSNRDLLLSFNMVWQFESCCDWAIFEYSTNAGADWQVLNAQGSFAEYPTNGRFLGQSNGLRHFINPINFLREDSTVQFRLRFVSDGSITAPGIIFDDFKIASVNRDLAISSLVNPAPLQTDFSEPANISFVFNNNGNDIDENVSFFYQVDQGEVFSQTFPISVEVGQSDTLTFTSAFLFSELKTYELKIWHELSNDQRNLNDTLLVQVINYGEAISVFPYLNDFEEEDYTWVTGGVNSTWAYGTPNKLGFTNVAPSGEKAWMTGGLSGFYAPNEASYLLTPVFDFSEALGMIEVSFKSASNLYFADWVRLQYTLDGINWQTVIPQSGSQNFPANGIFNSWNSNLNTSKTAIDTLLGKERVQFRFYLTSDGSSQASGMIIDDFEVNVTNYDLAINNVLSPLASDSLSNGPLPVSILIENKLIEIKNQEVAFHYQINDSITVSENFTLNLDPGQTDTLTFNSLGNFTVPNIYRLKIWHELDGDGVNSNDTLNYEIRNFGPPIASFPYFNDFESDDFKWLVQGAISSWNRGIPQKLGFDGEAPSGQNAWMIGGPSGDYLNSENGWLLSPVFDFSDITTDVSIKFDVAYDMADVNDYLQVQYKTAPQGAWFTMAERQPAVNMPIDNRFTGTSNGLISVENNINNLLGLPYVQFRFLFISNWSGVSKGLILDNFELSILERDLGISQVVSPASNITVYNEVIPLTFTVLNGGLSLNEDVEFFYQINEEAVQSQVFTVNLEEQASINLTFADSIDLIEPGTYSIRIWHNLLDDERPLNDTIEVSRTNYGAPISSFPYKEDFETKDFRWIAEGTNSSWEYGSVEKLGLEKEGISGMNAWALGGLNGEYRNAERSYLRSPVFDFRGLNGSIELSFNTVYEIQNFSDYVRLQYSADGGQTWVSVPSHILSVNYQNNGNFTGSSNGVIPVKVDVSFLKNQDKVQFRFWFFSDLSVVAPGFVIDDFELNPINYDLALNAILSPVQSNDFSEPLALSFNVRNLGEDLVDEEVPFQLSINNDLPRTEYYRVTAQNGELVVLTSINTLDLSADGVYNIKLWSSFENDQRRVNDTLTSRVVNYGGEISTLPFFTDFEDEDFRWITTGSANTWNYGTPNKLGLENEAISGSKAWVVGSLDGNYGNNQNASLISPVFNFSNFENALELNYKLVYKTETGFDYIFMRYSINGGANWSVMPVGVADVNVPSNGRHTGDSDGVIEVKRDISFLAGYSNVQFAFVFISDGSVVDQGFVLDDFRIKELGNDLRIAKMTTLLDPLNAVNEFYSVGIRLRNSGSNAIDESIGFAYNFEGNIILQSFEVSVAPGDSLDLTFDQQINVEDLGLFDLKVWHTWEKDERRVNDTIFHQFRNIGPFVSHFPYFNDFETDSLSWHANGVNNSWHYGTPNKLGYSNTAPSGTKAWVLGRLSGLYNNNENSALYSPIFDFSQSTGLPLLSFKLAFETESFRDYLFWEYRTSDTGEWQRVPRSITSENYPSDLRWHGGSTSTFQVVNEIPALSGAPYVQFRWRFSSDASRVGAGAIFDDFEIKFVQSDLSMYTILNPTDSSNLLNPQFLRFQVINTGESSINSGLTFYFQVNEEEPKEELFIVTANPNDTLQFQFSQPLNLRARGEYNISVWFEWELDTDETNNLLELFLFHDALSADRSAGLILYPNPAKEMVFIKQAASKFNLSGSTFKLYDISGKLHKEGKIGGYEMELDVKDLKSGLYYIELHQGQDKAVLKLIIN